LKRLLINTSNIHVGGGVQVAVSFIDELTRMSNLPPGLVVWASDLVNKNLINQGSNLCALPNYEVVNSNGIRLLLSSLSLRLRSFDTVFTLFGPLYLLNSPFVNITGFAQPSIIYPQHDLHETMSFPKRWFNKVKFSIQSIFFRKADYLVVELEQVRAALLRQKIGFESNIYVIRNCLSSLYASPKLWQETSVPQKDVDIKLGYLGRNYLHKNTKIFPEVIRILSRNYGINAAIFVTFTAKEWSLCSDDFKKLVVNVGPLLVSQCPSFYTQMDAIIFPSLLECFSATPLEAMAMRKPIFASDRPFNREICCEYANYFEPLSPDSAAKEIANFYFSGGRRPDELSSASTHAFRFSSAQQRAHEYLSLLMTDLK